MLIEVPWGEVSACFSSRHWLLEVFAYSPPLPRQSSLEERFSLFLIAAVGERISEQVTFVRRRTVTEVKSLAKEKHESFSFYHTTKSESFTFLKFYSPDSPRMESVRSLSAIEKHFSVFLSTWLLSVSMYTEDLNLISIPIKNNLKAKHTSLTIFKDHENHSRFYFRNLYHEYCSAKPSSPELEKYVIKMAVDFN